MSTPMLGRLLIVDDEVELMTALREMLTAQGYEVVGLASGQEALEALREREFDLLLTDLMMPGLDGITLLRAAQEIDPYLVGVIMTGQGTVQTAVEAMKTGAFDYVLKPFKLSAVLPILSRALDVRRLHMENVQLRETVAIYELSQAIAFTLDLNTILNKAADAALQQCEADEVSIMLPTREGDELYVAVVRGEQRQHMLGARVPLEQGIAGWVARHREPLTLHGEVRDPRFAPLHPRPDIHSAISLPMLAGNYLVGVLNVNTIRRQRRLTLGQVKALSILVSTAAAALENARLYEAVQQELAERQRAEEALRESEGRYRDLVENSQDLICTHDLEGKLLSVNEAAVRLTGYPREGLLQMNMADLLAPDVRRVFSVYLKEIRATGQASGLMQVQTAGGETRYWEYDNTLRTEGVAVPIVRGMAHDITTRKQAEDALRNAEARYRALFEQSPNGVLLIDLETGKTIEANETAHKQLGFTREEFAALRISDYEVLEKPEETAKRMQKTIREGNDDFETLHRTKSGEIRDMHVWVKTVQLSDRGLFYAIFQDITERKRAEAQIMRQLQRITGLRTIDMAITSSFDLRLTLGVVLDEAIVQLRVDAADVLLFNRHMQTLEYAAGRGFRGRAIERSHFRLGEGQASRAALERRMIQHPDFAASGAVFAQAELLAAENVAAYFAVPLIAKGEIKGVLEIFHRSPLQPDSEWLNFLETLAGQAAIAVDNAQLFDGLQRSNAELSLAYDATIEGWSHALDLRDKETEGHTQRVTEMALRLAKALGIAEAEIVHIRRGALLHDIGKMGVPDEILRKPGPLTDDEGKLMRLHPDFAYDMLSPINYLRPALDIPYCHHEKWDGSGYPRGLKDEQIPLAARLFAVVDVWDALRSDRPYRAAWPEEKVIEHIKAGSGSHFDPTVVEVFLKVMG